ncbi:MAG: FTR1 family protein [Gemmatimonadales bacterium]
MKMILKFPGRVLAPLCVALIAPATAQAQDSLAIARRVFATAQLAAEEYRVGVVGGRIVAAAEVDEARLFIAEAGKASGELPAAARSAAAAPLSHMAAIVERTGAPDSLDAAVRDLGQALTGHVGGPLEPIPAWAAPVARGKQLFGRSCAGCHGDAGRGDGPAAAGLEPPPADLTDPSLTASSPLDFYRRITLGVAGTGMPGFEATLEEEDRWAVALYASTLRLPAASGRVPDGLRGLARSAALTDVQLLALLGHGGEAHPTMSALAQVAAVREAGGAEARSRRAAVFDSIRAQVAGVESLAASGERARAGRAALAAYMTFEGVERELLAQDAKLARELEEAFTALRLGAEGGSAAGSAKLAVLLDRAEQVLGIQQRPVGMFVQSLVLLVREGVEAILIVGALLAFLTRIGAGHRARDIKAGIGAAIGASLLTAVLIETVFHLTPADQEVLEGGTMLVATVVLFSVSYWLLTKLEVAKWNRFVRSKVEEAVAGGSSLALASVAFLAVYREGFETVLFYKALLVSGGAGATLPILMGMAVGAVILVALFIAIQRFGVRLPLKPFFAVTSAFLYWMAFTFAGHGIAELQAGGVMSTTPVIGLPWAPRIGVYPTLETALAQGGLLLLALGAVVWTFVVEPRARQRATESTQPSGPEARKAA